MNISVYVKDFTDFCKYFYQNIILSNGIPANLLLNINVKFLQGAREFDLYNISKLQEIKINYPGTELSDKEICLLDLNIFKSPFLSDINCPVTVKTDYCKDELSKHMYIEELEHDETCHNFMATFAIVQTGVDRYSFFYRNIHFSRSEDLAFRRKLSEQKGELVMYRYLDDICELNRLKKKFPSQIKYAAKRQDLADIFVDFYDKKDN